MKWITICLMLLSSITTDAQVNLVPNPSFEDTVSCPNATNQVGKAIGWHPSRNSPDYFNACDWINGQLGVPNNTAGYQFARSGDAYCGLIAYMRNDPNYREDFTCALLNPLTIGIKYNVSFYSSWSGKYRLACNKLGVLFSTINYNAVNNAPLSNYCQFYSDSIIVDSVGWVLLQGTFIADSNYSFLTIGNFFDSSQVDTIYPIPSSIAYYYIDDVSVTADTTTSLAAIEGDNGVTFYPNPVRDKLHITSASNNLLGIEIINTVGQLVLMSNGESFKTEIDVSKLKAGIYLLKLNYKNKKTKIHKLLKL